MTTLLMAALTAYIVACVIGSSSLFEHFRKWVMIKLPAFKIGNHKHFIECRLCLTFWTSLAAILMYDLSFTYLLPTYGLAYFAATQER